MAPPERDLDEETSVGVEGVWEEPAEVSPAVVVGAAVVAVDEGVLDEVVLEEAVVEGAWEVVSVAAIKAWGLKDQEVASGSAALRDV